MWNTFAKVVVVGFVFNFGSLTLMASEEGTMQTDKTEKNTEKTDESRVASEAQISSEKEIPVEKHAEEMEAKPNLVYMFSDVQGRHEALKALLVNYQIIDEALNWQSANNDLVLMGNLIGDEGSAYETLRLVSTLQQNAMQSQSKLKIILGEKDIEFLLSEFDRYPDSSGVAAEANSEASPDIKSQEQTANQPQAESQTEAESQPQQDHLQLLNWLSGQDFVAQMNGHLFVNGGISSRTKKKALNDINQALKRSLNDYKSRWQALLETETSLKDVAFNERYSAVSSLPDSEEKKLFLKSKRSYLFSKFWPVQYTGNSFCHPLFERQNLDEILQSWTIKKIWSAKSEYKALGFEERFQGLMTFVDQDLESADSGQILGAMIEEDGSHTLLQGVKTVTDVPKTIPARKYELPYGMTIDEIKRFLKTAKVVSKEQTKEGKTKPLKIYLEKGDKRIKAIFKYVNASGRGNRKGVPRTGDKFDYESAAYTLDGMLGIGLIPITVERVVNNKRGVVQLWIDGLVSAVPLNSGEEVYSGMCDAQQQENMINTFDYLIMNMDRNQTNITFTKKDWQIWFIDHTRSFSNDTKAPRFLKGVKIKPTGLFKEKLSQISREQLNDLSLWLSEKQLDAMWQRRNRLIESDYILD